MRFSDRSEYIALVTTVLTVVLSLLSQAAEAQPASCGAPPPAHPQRITGGESFPPLPLPVTPLRRTERKRPPTPPLLIGKLRYGGEKQSVTPDGRQYTYFDWKSDPADAARLLEFAGPKLGINYRADVIGAKDLGTDPSKTPILYITGHQAFNVPDWFGEQLRAYIAAGGSVVADACCGSQPFVESFTQYVRNLYPNRRFEPLAPDHPLYRSYYEIAEVTFQDGTKVQKKGPPELLGLEIGCRAAIIFSRYDLSCGWDGHEHDVGYRVSPHGDPPDAFRLGINILAYCLANQELGRFLARQKVYQDAGAPAGPDAFVFGQLVHQGDWDPDPSAVANLLKAVNSNSAIEVKFARKQVDARTADLFDIPFLYMTGHHDFTFGDDEVKNLRAYLVNGGTLLADACCGRAAFDQAFRRELNRILPDRPLQPIPLDDPIYQTLYKVENLSFFLSGARPPELEGIAIDGFYAVVYSKHDIGNGWEGVAHPLVDGVASEDSLRLGMNVILYALTH